MHPGAESLPDTCQPLTACHAQDVEPGKPVATQLANACGSCKQAVEIMQGLDPPANEFYVETKLDGRPMLAAV